jgi:CubicO group peptidase (beta-lactamase class C family)
LAAAIICATAPAGWGQALGPAATPEAVGFDSARLERLHGYLADEVAQGRAIGFVTLLARHGKTVELKTYGRSDLASDRAMAPDEIFELASMTKPITGVALMMLFEEGKWRLNDPITKYLPELKSLKVLAGTGPDGKPILVDMKRPPTMRELMSHTAGFGYYLDATHPVDKLFLAADVLGAQSSQQLVDRVAGLPLVYQPGDAWYYSIAVDLQGVIVERLSGMRLGEFMRTRIFEPLGMRDTGFYVDPAKLQRLATLYSVDPKTGRLTPLKILGKNSPVQAATSPPPFESGGVGLMSTAGDYARFCQMILGGGELDGVRILSPASIALMGASAAPFEVLTSSKGDGRFNPGEGFGLDFKVIEDPRRAGRMEGAGTLNWNGVFGTWFWVDPANGVVFVGMVQRLGPNADEFGEMARILTYQALTHPEK